MAAMQIRAGNMLLRTATLLAACVAVGVGHAAAQPREQPSDIPCDSTKLVIQLANPKCSQFKPVQSSMGGVPGTGRMASGPINILSNEGGLRASIQASVPDVPGMFMTPPKEADVTGYAQRYNGVTRAGTEWSTIRTLGNAWVWTFRSGGSHCAFFDNYGPLEGNGYAWAVRGVICRSEPAYSDDDLKKALTLVVPKK